MKIAEITTYKEGGAYTHVIELVKRFDLDTIIVTGNTKKSGFEKEDGFLYYHIPLLKSMWEVFFINRPGAYNELEKTLLDKNINLVHFHSPLFTFLHGFLKKKKFPVVMTTHYLLNIKANRLSAVLYHKFIRWMTRYVGKNVDKIICVNEEYIPVFTKWGIDSKKLTFIPNGVDTNKFSPGDSNIKKEFKDSKIIVYFGRLHYQKNVELLVKSFKLIKEKMKNVKLVIIGTGNQYDKLKRMTAEDKDVIMTGFISDKDLLDYLRAADIVVFPSRGENASFTIMEAMSCELPVVSSDVGNAKKILGSERGILLKEYTKKEIADICVKVLSDKKLSKNIGKKARKYVIENHSWDKISKQTEEIYKKILNECKKN